MNRMRPWLWLRVAWGRRRKWRTVFVLCDVMVRSRKSSENDT